MKNKGNNQKNFNFCFVLIERFDLILCAGRVHSANVSGVDFVGQNVTVEWFEFGETKGKEV